MKNIFQNRQKVIIGIIICVSVSTTCHQNQVAQANGPAGNTVVQTSRSFVLPEIPALLVDPGERTDYLVSHYWEHFDFSDTTQIKEPQKQVTEQAFVDYIDLLSYVQPEKAGQSLKQLIKDAESSGPVYDYFAGLSEQYLYDPNSPFRNEEFYITVLKQMMASGYTDDIEKQVLQYRMQQVCKNRVGERAADFAFTLASGKQGRMYRIPANYLILYFYNPGCHACAEVQEQLEASPVIADMLEDRQLRILAVYTDDDMDAWRDYQDKLPSLWFNAYASQAVRDSLYDLRAIPTAYLLNSSKKVLLKDATLTQLEEALIAKIK